MEDIMTEQLNVDSIDMVDHDNADDDEYSMEIRNDSGESFDDGISILPSEPSDPTSASTLQLDELEELVDDDAIEENEILNELQIRPKTLYKRTKSFIDEAKNVSSTAEQFLCMKRPNDDLGPSKSKVMTKRQFSRISRETNPNSPVERVVHAGSPSLYPRLSIEELDLVKPAKDSKNVGTNRQNGFIPNNSTLRRSKTGSASPYLMDFPSRSDPHGPAIIYGVESEEIEEINDAYNDLIEDLGLSKVTEDDQEEFVPSCGPLLVLEYLVNKMEVFWTKSSPRVGLAY